jgi:hypothetical protein
MYLDIQPARQPLGLHSALGRPSAPDDARRPCGQGLIKANRYVSLSGNIQRWGGLQHLMMLRMPLDKFAFRSIGKPLSGSRFDAREVSST